MFHLHHTAAGVTDSDDECHYSKPIVQTGNKLSKSVSHSLLHFIWIGAVSVWIWATQLKTVLPSLTVERVTALVDRQL